MQDVIRDEQDVREASVVNEEMKDEMVAGVVEEVGEVEEVNEVAELQDVDVEEDLIEKVQEVNEVAELEDDVEAD